MLATLRADRYKLTSPLEQIAEAEPGDVAPGLAAPDVGVIALPAGPALRVRRILRAGTGSAGAPLIEAVRHLAAPPRVVDSDGDPTAVELTMTWSVLQEGDEFADMADQTAGLLRITTG